MRVIKLSFHLISTPLANIINLSLLKGIFPDKLKNWQSNSHLQHRGSEHFFKLQTNFFAAKFRKIFEKVIYNRLVEFSETSETFFLRQFGFRKNPRHHVLLHLLVKSRMQLTNMKPLQVSFWIFLKRLIPSIMNSYLRGYLNFERAFELGSELQ